MPGKAVTEKRTDKLLLNSGFCLNSSSRRSCASSRQPRSTASRGPASAGPFAVQPLGVEPHWADLDVLYEDDFCLVVHKPAGMKLHPDGGREEQVITLDHAVASYYEINGIETSVRHVHRLDEDTTGPVLYAKNAFALAKLDEAMRRKAIDRQYVAITGGQVPSDLRKIDAPIGRTGTTSNADVSPKEGRMRLLMWTSCMYGTGQRSYV